MPKWACMAEISVDWVGKYFWSLVWSIIAVAIIWTIYGIFSNFLKQKGIERELEPHIINAIRLLLRVVAIIATVVVIFSIFDISTSVFIGGSALIGAAIGFGSSQTINNIVAGFYVLISQPFKVKDYVKIGDLEGQVEEISINYTSLYTPTFNLLKVPNTQVLGSRILNMTHEGYIKYTYQVTFGHELTEKQVNEQIMNPAVNEFHEYCGEGAYRCPEYYLYSANRLELVYMIRLFIPKGEARLLYTQMPELTEIVMKHYDDTKPKS
jgi:small-conductance mechanosensitive channel